VHIPGGSTHTIDAPPGMTASDIASTLESDMDGYGRHLVFERPEGGVNVCSRHPMSLCGTEPFQFSELRSRHWWVRAQSVNKPLVRVSQGVPGLSGM
jgi:hypothetical protein